MRVYTEDFVKRVNGQEEPTEDGVNSFDITMMTAKRARQINSSYQNWLNENKLRDNPKNRAKYAQSDAKGKPMVPFNPKSFFPVSIAAREIWQGKVYKV